MDRKRCARARAVARVYAYLDGEIRALRRVRIRRHLRKCRYCNRIYEFEQRFVGFVRERIRVEAPPEVVERIRSSIQDLRRR